MNGIESSDVASEFEVMGGSHSGSSCLLPVELTWVSQSCARIREKRKKKKSTLQSILYNLTGQHK